MRFHTGQHQHYCGVDLHTRATHFCILNCEAEIVLRWNTRANPDQTPPLAPGDLCVSFITEALYVLVARRAMRLRPMRARSGHIAF